eukprot:GHVS01083027.1.p2 GENE.GHVS01083027.1~~GHVS01083027.1.p2  ORF type:complete len:103 (-),score=7.21 GHVS01083027.1:607-915(-)
MTQVPKDTRESLSRPINQPSTTHLYNSNRMNRVSHIHIVSSQLRAVPTLHMTTRSNLSSLRLYMCFVIHFVFLLSHIVLHYFLLFSGVLHSWCGCCQGLLNI